MAIGEEAVKAAIDLVDLCIQQAAYLAGRGDVQDTIKELARGNVTLCVLHLHTQNTHSLLIHRFVYALWMLIRVMDMLLLAYFYQGKY